MSEKMQANIFENTTIQKHNNNLCGLILPEKMKEFGVVSLKIRQYPMTQKKQHFIFMIDTSGSMNHKCSDGQTKLFHIIYTLENMILYFIKNPEVNIYISVYSFNDVVEPIFEKILINTTNQKYLLKKVKSLKPTGQTNIELALKITEAKINLFLEKEPDIEISNIFMTDGEATTGEKDHKILKKYINSNILTSMIGFGIKHNAYLLNSITKESLNSNYYFIDIMEKAGLVYAEIINAIVYKVLKNVVIKIENGFIYNWRLNQWTTTYVTNNFISETENNIHIVSENISNCLIKISGNLNDTNEYYSEIIDCKNVVLTDLTKFVFRQKTMELLYNVSIFEDKKYEHKNIYDGMYIDIEDEMTQNLIEENEKLTNNMKNLLKEIKDYMIENDVNDDVFMKNLCDDIYITFKTFNTKYGSMYSCSRQTSQGTQRCYNVSTIPSELSLNNQNLSHSDNDNLNNDNLNNDNLNNTIYMSREHIFSSITPGTSRLSLKRDDYVDFNRNYYDNSIPTQEYNKQYNISLNFSKLFDDNEFADMETLIKKYGDVVIDNYALSDDVIDNYILSNDSLNTTNVTPSRLNMMHSFTQDH